MGTSAFSNVARPESVDVPVEIVRPRVSLPPPVQRINSYNPAVLPGLAPEAAARDLRTSTHPSLVPPPMIPQHVGGSGSLVMSSCTPVEVALALTPTRAPKTSQMQPISR